MVQTVRSKDDASQLKVATLALFIILLLVMGGASRADALSQPFIRLISIVVIVVAGLNLNRTIWRQARIPLLLLALLALSIVIQLVPLPPGLWASLPGRGGLADILSGAGIAEHWRPISLAPDQTLNSFLALLPAFAALLLVSTVAREQMSLLLTLLVCGVVLSGLLGALQVASGAGYLYRITNEGSATGLFANRNHNAVFLACGLPLLACWAVVPQPSPELQRLRHWLALCAAAGIYPLLLITGSRGGLVLGMVGTAFAMIIAYSGRRTGAKVSMRSRMFLLLPILVSIVGVAAAVFLSRDEALQRIMAQSPGEIRLSLFPLFVQMARDYFPFGAGFGSFDTIFRMYEPYESLDPNYLNQAHNDWVQLVIEGGLFASLVALIAIGWVAYALVRSWRSPRGVRALYARTGGAIIILLVLGSLGDYPLRTPTLSALCLVASYWLFSNLAPSSKQGGVGRVEHLG